MDKKVWAIIVAAGSGSRMAGASGIPKQFLPFAGHPLYWHSALAFARCACIEGIVFVFPGKYLEREAENIRRIYEKDNPGFLYRLAAGGATRRESAGNGLARVPRSCQKIMIHDAARPFLEPELVWRLYNSLEPDCAAVIPGIAVTDTIKLAADGIVEQTPPREKLYAIQTPQIFQASLLREAHASSSGFAATDDATLLEMLGYKVRLIEGAEDNVKITTPRDLKMLDRQEKQPMPCSGFGYDVHKFGPGRPLKLGGVQIPGDYELVAHSDGDVLLHALIDAILGCASLGDIGSHFPDKDQKYEGISSAILLENSLVLARGCGVRICHVDLTVVAQKPRLEPWKREIAKNVARLCYLPANCVNLKATTEEGLGFTGRVEGIKAYVMVSALKS